MSLDPNTVYIFDKHGKTLSDKARLFRYALVPHSRVNPAIPPHVLFLFPFPEDFEHVTTHIIYRFVGVKSRQDNVLTHIQGTSIRVVELSKPQVQQLKKTGTITSRDLKITLIRKTARKV